MKEFFGIPMQSIAMTLAFLLIVVMAVVIILALRNRILVKLALRNIPRRPAQTILIIVGLMLSTTIIAASLAIGDTVAGTIRGTVLDSLGQTDLRVRSPLAALAPDMGEESDAGAFGDTYIDAARQQAVLDTTAGDDRIDGVLPQIRETLPVLNERSQLTEARMMVVGFDASRTDGFGSVTSTDGESLDIASLGPNEVFLNERAADEIEAQAGDALTVVTPTGRQPFTVRAVVKEGGLAANDKRVLMRLDTMQQVMDRAGQVNRIDISLRETGEEGLGLSGETADDLTIAFTDPAAAESLFTTLKAPEVLQAIEDRIEENPSGSINPVVKKDLQSLVTELRDNSGATDEFRLLIVDPQIAAQVLAALDGAGLSSQIIPVTTQLASVQVLAVDELKQSGLDIAVLISSLITSLFTVFGSFSIIVGLLLIFLVFVMLAAARSNEMGIARAVGTKRRHLVEMFTFEGVAYAVGAAIVGTIIGLVASRVLVQLLISAFGAAGEDEFTFHYSITLYSVIAGFCLGLLLTLITVGVSAYRVSKLNIVVAIRGLPAAFERSDTPPLSKRILRVGHALLGPVYYLYRVIKLGRRGDDVTRPMLLFFIMLAVIPWLINIGIAIYKVFSPYFAQGWPLIIVGALVAISGISLENAALWTLGMSAAFVGVALLVKTLLYRSPNVRKTVADRIGFTLMGVLILAFWMLPFTALEGITGELTGGIEMFVLSGVWMVASAVWIVMYNADLITGALQATLGRIRRLRPILKPAIAYPMGSRFRTGLTVAMFALVIFTMMVFSILNNLGADIVDTPDRATGGFDVRAETSEDLPVTDIRSQIEASQNLNINDFQVIAADRDISTEARQEGAEERRFLDLGVRGADEAYLRNVNLEFSHYDPSFLPSGVDPSDEAAVARALWDRLAEDPSLAVITSDRLEAAAAADFGFGPARFQAEGVAADDPLEIEAFTVEVRQPRGRSEATTRTVIAVLETTAGQFEGGPDQGPFSGITTGTDIFSDLSDEPVPLTTFRIRLAPGVDAGRTAAAMETAFLDNSMEATDTLQEIKDGVAANNAFGRLFQGFMGLGLVVGVAALGVLSFRAVVERRHSIGMMRAVGYKSRMIQTQFLIESIFITILGSLLGLGLGAWLSWLLVDSFRETTGDVTYAVPWATVSVILVVALVASLATTYIPARQASKIYPSEALRYE